MAKSIASTLSSVFGGEVMFFRTGDPIRYPNVVIRKDVEVLDEQGQVVARIQTVRIANDDIDIVPARGDTIQDGGVTYTLGNRLTDNGYFYLFEVTT